MGERRTQGIFVKAPLVLIVRGARRVDLKVDLKVVGPSAVRRGNGTMLGSIKILRRDKISNTAINHHYGIMIAGGSRCQK